MKGNHENKLLPFQSEFSHRHACWANNHNGWAKMKKTNKMIAKAKIKRQIKQEIEKEVSTNK